MYLLFHQSSVYSYYLFHKYYLSGITFYDAFNQLDYIPKVSFRYITNITYSKQGFIFIEYKKKNSVLWSLGITSLSNKDTLVSFFKKFYFKYVLGSYDNLFLFHSYNIYGKGSNSYGELGIGNKDRQDQIISIKTLSEKNILSLYLKKI